MVPLQISDDDALRFLSAEGYLPLTLADHPGMVSAYTALFAATNHFFALPSTSPEKTAHLAPSGPAASEEGFSTIPREKSIITVKTSSHCPPSLQPHLQTAWALTGTLLAKITRLIAQTLHLDPDVFTPFVDPCVYLPEKGKRTPTLVRMFRYDRPPGGGGGGGTAPEPKVNAEQHKDLGLLSLVVGHSPGLQALDPSTNRWIAIEDPANLPPDSTARSNGLTATLLTGETLAFLSRGVYKAGVHRVVCAPSSPTSSSSPSLSSPENGNGDGDGDDRYRFSIVFTLRAAPAPLFTGRFESDVVGVFGEGERSEGESLGVLFERIMRGHWNVNAAVGVREAQKRRFEGGRKEGGGRRRREGEEEERASG